MHYASVMKLKFNKHNAHFVSIIKPVCQRSK